MVKTKTIHGCRTDDNLKVVLEDIVDYVLASGFWNKKLIDETNSYIMKKSVEFKKSDEYKKLLEKAKKDAQEKDYSMMEYLLDYPGKLKIEDFEIIISKLSTDILLDMSKQRSMVNFPNLSLKNGLTKKLSREVYEMYYEETDIGKLAGERMSGPP